MTAGRTGVPYAKGARLSFEHSQLGQLHRSKDSHPSVPHEKYSGGHAPHKEFAGTSFLATLGTILDVLPILGPLLAPLKLQAATLASSRLESVLAFRS